MGAGNLLPGDSSLAFFCLCCTTCIVPLLSNAAIYLISRKKHVKQFVLNYTTELEILYLDNCMFLRKHSVHNTLQGVQCMQHFGTFYIERYEF